MNAQTIKTVTLLTFLGLLFACKKNEFCENVFIAPQFEYERYSITKQISGFSIQCSDHFYNEQLSFTFIDEIDTNAIDTITIASSQLFSGVLSTIDSSVCAESETWRLSKGNLILEDSSVYLGEFNGIEYWDRHISFRLTDAVFKNLSDSNDSIEVIELKSPNRLKLIQ